MNIFSAAQLLLLLLLLAVTTSLATATPTATPTAAPTASPTATPTAAPTATPTATPTAAPTASPTATPTAAPTATPTAVPSYAPTPAPTGEPTGQPSRVPTGQPSAAPTGEPTREPTGQPSRIPTGQPTTMPTQPTGTPTTEPTRVPSGQPTCQPTGQPTRAPTGTIPTGAPSSVPSPWTDTRTAPVDFFSQYGGSAIGVFIGFCFLSSLVYICFTTSVCELKCWSPELATRVHYEEKYRAEADRATFREVYKDGSKDGHGGGGDSVFAQVISKVTGMCKATAELSLVPRNRDDVDHRTDIFERRILVSKAKLRLKQGVAIHSYLASGIGTLNSTIRSEEEEGKQGLGAFGSSMNSNSSTINETVKQASPGKGADDALLL